MFIDNAVVASLIVVGGTLVFLGGFAYFAYKVGHQKPPQGSH